MNGSVTEWNAFNGRGKVSNDEETHPLSSGDCTTRLRELLSNRAIPPDDAVSVTYIVAGTGDAINADLVQVAARAMAVAPMAAAPAPARPPAKKKSAKKKATKKKSTGKTKGKVSSKTAARKPVKKKAKAGKSARKRGSRPARTKKRARRV